MSAQEVTWLFLACSICSLESRVILSMLYILLLCENIQMTQEDPVSDLGEER